MVTSALASIAISHRILFYARADGVVALSERNKYHSVQNGDRKCGTHARPFSQTLAHGNRKNEKDKKTE